MNKVIIVGRLTRDPEVRVNGEKSIARTSVAVNMGKERTEYINVTAFNKKAELMEKYFRKGDRIGIIGSIHIDSYTNRDGQKVNTTEIWVEEIDFLQDKREEGVDDNPFL